MPVQPRNRDKLLCVHAKRLVQNALCDRCALHTIRVDGKLARGAPGMRNIGGEPSAGNRIE